MSYNFKEALDDLEYLKIAESKADDFFKLIISTLRKNSVLRNEIREMTFSLSTYEYQEDVFSIRAMYSGQGENIQQDKKLPATYSKDICNMVIRNKGEAIAIFTVIEDELKKTNGFVCEDITSVFNEKDGQLLKLIKVTL